MRPLRVRAYNVEFGDAILVSIPEKVQNEDDMYRHILIDVGNRGTKDDNRHFKPVLENVLGQLDGNRLDLYVVSHEHLDHVQGLPYAEKKVYDNDERELLNKLNPKHTWFPVSSRPGYYDNPALRSVKEKHDEIEATLAQIGEYLAALRSIGEPIGAHLETLWAINNIGRTKDCVKYLKEFKQPSYVHRGFITDNHHPFSDAKIEIWAPEENVGLYLEAFSPQHMNLNTIETPADDEDALRLAPLVPPQGVDAGAFYNLVASRQRFYENLLFANSSTNNTSIVFCLEWRGNRLLFTGDAEELSWRTMNEKGALRDVHFLKVSHHGSHNGTPEPEILDKILPPDSQKNRFALVSTALGPYESVPDSDTLGLIEERCEKLYRLHTEKDPGEYQDIYFAEKT